MRVFDIPQELKRYDDGTFRFVSNEKIIVGDQVNYNVPRGEYNRKATVIDILEERQSMGEFISGERPYSYRLRLEP